MRGKLDKIALLKDLPLFVCVNRFSDSWQNKRNAVSLANQALQSLRDLLVSPANPHDFHSNLFASNLYNDYFLSQLRNSRL